MSRIDDGLQWLAEQFSASHEEFRKAMHPGGDMLLTACLTGGYAHSRNARVAVSEQGRRRLADKAPVADEAEA